MSYTLKSPGTILIEFDASSGATDRNRIIKDALNSLHVTEVIKAWLHKKGMHDMEYGDDLDLAFADSITIKFKIPML